MHAAMLFYCVFWAAVAVPLSCPLLFLFASFWSVVTETTVLPQDAATVRTVLL